VGRDEEECFNNTAIESNGDVLTQQDYERLIDDTVKELRQISSSYGRVIDVDSAVELLGVDRTWATHNKVESRPRTLRTYSKA
jgi:predicted transglutaminase-like cysteine proteinase